MENNSTVVGLDVHKETITIAVLRPNQDRSDPSATFENRPSIIEKKVKELNRRHAPLEFVYEAGPGGFALYRQLTQLGHRCAVIAPARRVKILFLPKITKGSGQHSTLYKKSLFF
jgi:transposase